MAKSDDVESRYAAALSRFVSQGGEEALVVAYEIGRTFLGAGASMLEVTRIHRRAMWDLSVAPGSDREAQALTFLEEALAPFEMALRGVQDANRALRRLNQELESRVDTRTRELRQAQQKYQQLVESSPAIVYAMRCGDKPRFEYVGPQLASVLGYDAETWTHEERMEAVVKEDQRLLLDALARIEQAREFSLRYRMYDSRGDVRWVHDQGHVATEDERVVLHGLMTDVTEQHGLEEALRHSQKMQVVGQLAGGVAHDFNNLLAVILSFAQFLEDEIEDPRARDDLGEIVRAARRGSDLTRQLLAFSRRQVVQPRTLALAEHLGETHRMLERVLGETIELQLSNRSTSGSVNIDPGHLEQVLVNLAANARDAMPSGGKLTIETRDIDLDEDHAAHLGGVAPGRYVQLAVSDTGHGMDQDTLKRIFEPFFTTKPPGEGTGLGLATCYGIVRQAGGHISVYSEPKRGTSFKIYLPRVDGERLLEHTAVTPALVLEGDERLLVVEDDDAIRKIICRTLSGFGYEIVEAREPTEALRVLESDDGHFDLLISDVIMPNQTGVELFERARELLPTLRALFISGYTGTALLHQGELDEESDFMEKPFTPTELAQHVRVILDR